MTKAIGKFGWSCAALALLGIASCSEHRGDVTSGKQRLTTANGLAQNGLTTNGLVENGMWSNGMWSNGMWSNGMWSNGMWSNGMWSNGMWSNGMWSNGMWSNGMWSNGMWSNGLTGDAAVPGDTLRSNPYARQLLQYIYSCAMPAGSYDTTLDPNEGAPLVCASDADCDLGYTCSQNNCVIPLQGGGANGSGLGVNADGTTWWGQPAPGGATDLNTGNWGNCDESCQRWVSACLLARTNAYGVHVQISIRAPADAPPPVKAALKVDDAGGERETFSLREGAFYGNIFATTPTTPAPAGGTGVATGPVASTPQYFACAGPGSNIPAITKRFCSSQGDQVVITVPGMCLATATQKGTCVGEDTDPSSETRGAIQSCHTTAIIGPQGPCADYRDPSCYSEVLTVYLRQPIAVCGNAVCEDDGTPTTPETATSCPSDCHPAGWARLYDPTTGLPAGNGNHIAVSPSDDTIVLGALVVSSADVSLGGPVLPAGAGNVVVAKYTRDGAYLWGTRFSLPATDPLFFDLAVAGDGTVAFAGLVTTPGVGLVALTELSGTDGQVLAGWPILLGGTAAETDGFNLVATDANGNVFLAGTYTGTATFATTPPTSLTSSFGGTWVDGYVVKVRRNGTPEWAVTLNGIAHDMALAPSGDVLLSMGGNELVRLSSPTGTVARTLIKSAPFPNGPINFRTVVADNAGELYVTGELMGSYDFGPGCSTATLTTAFAEFFLAKYSPDGSQCRWVARAATSCPNGANPTYCSHAYFAGFNLKFGPDGNLLVGGYLEGVDITDRSAPAGSGAVVDLGAGIFETYRYPDSFVASYSTDGDLRWAKQIPFVLDGVLDAPRINSRGDIVVSGYFAGSAQVDDRALVDKSTVGFGTTFLASFAQPSSDDTTAPFIGTGTDATGTPLLTVPQDIYVQATSADGAVVFFMPPTAIDDGHAGTNVACSQAPNTTFPLGTTTVTCRASDPLGNKSLPVMFSVTVVDTLGPVLSGVPNVPPVPAAAGATSATVTYEPPTATDQVDGPRAVGCAPASGSVFAVGTTTVTCTSTDAHGNTSSASFTISVGDTTPPLLTLPGPITTLATSASGAVVAYSATASDTTDGMLTPVCTPPSGSTFPLGTTTVTCTVTDAAGNPASGTFQVSVWYGWSGFLQPIDADGNSVFKLGSTIPIKFQLAGASAGITNAVATLTLAKISSTVTGSDIEAISTSAATTGNLFRYDGGQYIFNLSTKGLSVGTWRLSVALGDGVSRTVVISLR